MSDAMMTMSEEHLPPGWSKHWSNTWKKNYWFHAMSGKKSWELPTGSEPKSSSNDVQPAGSKRWSEADSSKEHEQPSDPEKTSQAPKPHEADTADSAPRAKPTSSLNAGNSHDFSTSLEPRETNCV